MSRNSLLFELWDDLRSPMALPALFTGMVNGTLLVFLSISFAAMIFSGEMSSFASRAAGLTLFGTAVMGAAVVFLSAIKTHIPIVQDASTATLVGAMPVAATLLTVSGEAAFMTLTGILFLSSLITGITFWAISRFHLANLFRFIPYPVVGGFMAGTGSLLTLGGLDIMCGRTVAIADLLSLLETDLLAKWLPGVLIAVSLFLILQRFSHFLILPLVLLGCGVGYHLAFSSLGLTLDQARVSGFLLSGLPVGGLWPAFTLDSLAEIHWGMVLRQLPLALSVSLVSTLGMLLNTSGVEVATAEDIDLEHELKTLGIANIAASLGGSVPGYTALSLTMLGVKFGAVTRLGGIVSTLIVVGVLGAGGRLLIYFPQPLLGALVMFLGLSLLWDRIVLTFSRMPKLDYALILIITTVIAWQGFLLGVAAGIAATLVIFVIRFSRVSVIYSNFDLTRRRSHKQRAVPDQHLLFSEGRFALGYELSGYLFFGSSSEFVETVRAQLSGSVRLLLIDFSRVTGFDISADSNFQRLLQSTTKAGIPTILSSCPDALVKTLQEQKDSFQAIQATDLNAALEQGEDMLLEAAHTRLQQDSGGGRDALFDCAIDDMLKRLERLEWCELLAEKLKPWARIKSFSEGESVLKIDQQISGLYVLIAGRCDELNEGGNRCRDYDSGEALYPSAQFFPLPSVVNLIATTALQVLCLEPSGRQQLEAENPALALELDHYIMSAAVVSTNLSSSADQLTS